MTEIADERCDKRLELVAKFMLHQYGGVAGFCQAWDEYSQRGGTATARCLEATVRLLEYVQTTRREEESDLSDEELAITAAVELREMIVQQPELVLTAAGELGWTVQPPR